MVGAMSRRYSPSNSLKAYRRVCMMLLAAFILNVWLVSYGEHAMTCVNAICTPPDNTLWIFRADPEMRRTLGLFAARDVPLWVAWLFGLILPVMLLVTAVLIMPKRPWQE